ncbi:MAG: hypothetical protein AAGH15_22685, partial [Myxococcota bacterium]
TLAGEVALFDLDSRRRRVLLRLGSGATSLAFSPDGETLAVGDLRGAVHLVDPSTGRVRRELRPHRDWINRVAWSPDGKWLATTSDDRSVRVLDPEEGRVARIATTAGVAMTLAFTPLGDRVVYGDANRLVMLPVEATRGYRDPARLLEEAERRAGMRLEGLRLVPAPTSGQAEGA